jgi:transglutaminase-like putative cysteine protease
MAFAAQASDGSDKSAATTIILYCAVRDRILYDPYVPYDERGTYGASAVLARGRGHCVGKELC